MASGSQYAVSDRHSQAQAALLNCYVSTLETIAESMAGLCPEMAQPFTERLLRWPRRLICDMSSETLNESRTAVRSELRNFSEGAGQYLRDASQAATLIDSLAQISFARLREHTQAHCKLTEIACEQIEAGADLDDAERLHSMLRQQVTGLRANARRMQEDVAKVLDHVVEELEIFKARIENPGALATTDEITHLPNRTGTVHRLQNYLSTDAPFFTLIFKLEGYQDIPGDRAKFLVRRIAEHVRDVLGPTDLASRWADDRLLVLLGSDSVDGEHRAKQIAKGMSDRYFHDCKEVQVGTPSVNIIYWRSEPNLDIWELMERLDSA